MARGEVLEAGKGTAQGLSSGISRKETVLLIC